MKMELTGRMGRYLENNHRWVSKKELMQRAKHANYTYEETVKALMDLRDILNIGIIYVSPKDTKETLPPGEHYIYYDLPPKEKEQLAFALFFFDEM